MRSLLIKGRNALANYIRSFLHEGGIPIRQGIASACTHVTLIPEDAQSGLAAADRDYHNSYISILSTSVI